MAVTKGGGLKTVGTSHSDELLAHQALLYRSKEEFLAGTVPFIRDGLDCDDPIRIATTDRNTSWLRAELGPAARHVTFCENSQWYGHPVRALAALDRVVRALGGGGRRPRIIREPLWTAGTGSERKEWARHESLVNAALASASVSFVCTYDSGVVASEVMAQVTRTHPELVIDGSLWPSPNYTDPAVFNAECDRSPLPEPPSSALRLAFDCVGQLATLRAFMTSYATWAGAAPQSVEQFVQAVDEVATNAIEHGGESGVLRIWTGQQMISCEVRDTGVGLHDPLAGHLPPPPGRADLRGLWLARQFCDLVEVRSDPAGTTVRLHLALP